MERETAGQLMARKAGMWLLMITIVLLFAGLTLVFLFSTGREARLQIPPLFYFNTLALAASSWMVHKTYLNPEKQGPNRLLLGILLGCLFLVGQTVGWWEMTQAGLWIDGASRKVSFLYVLTGVHATHLIGGLLFLGFVWARERRGDGRFLETAVYFWHFLGVLWVYLLAVLSLNL